MLVQRSAGGNVRSTEKNWEGMLNLTVVLASLLLLVFFMMPAHCAAGSGEVEPTILVYAHKLPNFRDAMVEELRKDTRITEEIVSVDSAKLLRTLLRLPNIKAVVMAGGDIPTFTALENAIIQFFNEGGGLVAFHDFGNRMLAGRMAETVFPLKANSTKMGQVKEGKMQFELVSQDLMEINREMPSSFPVFDYEINLAWSSAKKSCVYRPPSKGEYWILYRDSEYGAPVVVAYKKEGFSVIFANGDVSDSADNRFRYFGNFFFDDDFLDMFVNSVVWVKDGETRTESLEQGLAAIEAEEKELQDFLLRVDRDERARRTRALALKIILTLAGLTGIALTYIFLIKHPGEENMTGGRHGR